MNDNLKTLSIGRNVKIGFFHLGSGMVDVLITGTWNRIMISDLGFAATPISLLAGLRYFLAPLGIWAGRVSDQRLIGGFRRLLWIWAGRAMMAASVFILGIQTASLAHGQEATLFAWLTLTSALLLFSLGNAISGSTFLALIYDRSAQSQRGRAIGIVWTFLLLGFTVGGILFSRILPEEPPADPLRSSVNLTPEAILRLFLIAGLVLAGLWFFSVLGEERRARASEKTVRHENQPKTSLREDLNLVWVCRPMRFFMFYLALSMVFAFSQDPILEPFGGDIFQMSARATTKFAAYWGSMSIAGTLAALWFSGRYKVLTHTALAYTGAGILLATFVLFTAAALAEIREFVKPGLILLGIGLGIWNIGTLGLMMTMSPSGQAGTFLGFWSVVVMFSRGIGISIGGIIRDATLQQVGNTPLSYAAVFMAGSFGLALALLSLRHVNARALDLTGAESSVQAKTLLAEGLD